MRVGFLLLGLLTVLVANCSATSLSDQAGVSTVSTFNLATHVSDGVNKRFLRSHVDGEEKSAKAALAKVDDLVDPVKLDAALSDVTKMKTLFKQWNADATVSKQVIERLSENRHTFAKYSSLVLTYNGYRIKVAENAAKRLAQEKAVDALVDPRTLDAALKDSTQMKKLFKQWNVGETMGMQVINRLATDPESLAKYMPLILKFNAYRMRVAEAR
ncbi:hypothetical protein PF008_g6595 [Phytophthora fragariae]|uniref:RxLR effector protein n=1 Tax=Phytophthora fragariae TaxID=53985 RepID=A0A6G0S5N2_9STRA|nr:hypothetical protein PF008_g6595 [Phytophthora fragariae]